MNDVPPLVSALGVALQPLASLRAVYLFGSRARSAARPDSDLDLGVVYDDSLNAAEREGVRRDVLTKLGAALGRLGESADLVDLHRSDSAVAFRAIHDGALVFARTAFERVAIEVRVARRYDDDAPKRLLFQGAAARVAAQWQRHG